ncbi:MULTISPECIES: hypothetical protein [Stenotrophomonas]|uniref:hypothetical protein n=1 Tax=Stenotrophomonas TaxID=40323 RepID=UPI00081C2CA5|nr:MULTISPECIES: hypothetical protein [Stenotrophomonas]
MDQVLKVLGVLAVAAALAGCGNLGKSNETRINDAIPPGSAVLASKQRLEVQLKAMGQDVAGFEQAYQQRLQQRARECGKDYKVSLFASSESVRDDLAGNTCFAESDAALEEWLVLQRMAVLLTAPPLRALAKPPASFISSNSTFQQPVFAAKAGVVVLQTDSKYRLIDMQTSEVLREAEGRLDGGTLSANGRLLTVAAADGGMEVLESATGEVLTTYAVSPRRFHWLEGVGAIFSEPAKKGTQRRTTIVLLDATVGKRIPIPLDAASVDQVLSVPGKPNHYLLFSPRRLAEIALQKGKDGWSVQLVSEQPTQFVASDRGLATAVDGSYVVVAQGQLRQFLLADRQHRILPLQPLLINAVWATPRSDELLLRARVAGPVFDYRHYVYSLSRQTLAQVDSTKLTSTQFIFIPSLQRNGVIDQTKIQVLEELPLLPAQAASSAIAQYQEEARVAMSTRTQQWAEMESNLRDVELAAAGASPEHQLLVQRARAALAARNQAVSAAPAAQSRSANAPLAVLAGNARIEAVGVYEAANGVHGVGIQRQAGSIQVRVRRSNAPTILVLSAYEPVNWMLTVESGANLQAVLVGGYHQGQVFGAGNARIMQLGRNYAYKRGDGGYSALDAEVQRLTGKSIGVFQGRYDGTTFVTGL